MGLALFNFGAAIFFHGGDFFPPPLSPEFSFGGWWRSSHNNGRDGEGRGEENGKREGGRQGGREWFLTFSFSGEMNYSFLFFFPWLFLQMWGLQKISLFFL